MGSVHEDFRSGSSADHCGITNSLFRHSRVESRSFPPTYYRERGAEVFPLRPGTEREAGKGVGEMGQRPGTSDPAIGT
jgi:hypothetical protein